MEAKHISPRPDGAAHDPARFDFHRELVAMLPRLRVQALSLTRSGPAADDLVQDAVANALRAQASFEPGTNFAAWTHRILRNRFVSTVRGRRETADIDDAPAAALAVGGAQEGSLALKELSRALGRLPADQRGALVMVAVQGLSHEEVRAIGCAGGTIESRVFRDRRQLQAWLLGEGDLPAAAAPAGRTQLADEADEARA